METGCRLDLEQSFWVTRELNLYSEFGKLPTVPETG